MLDHFDEKILRYLQEDATISAAQLGAEIGLSQSACHRRIKQLEDDGFIVRRVAILDPGSVGLNTTVLALVKLTAHGRANLEQFINAVAKLDRVLECFVILGEQDFFIKVAMKDIYEYERFFFQELSSLPGVAEVKSMVALSKIKNSTALPILD